MYTDNSDSEDKSTEATIGVSVHAGFPNAAEDREGAHKALDFNTLLVKHPSSTYCFRVEGKTYEGRGIFSGDIAVIDRALVPRPQDFVLYFTDDSFVITLYRSLKGRMEIWGVVTSIIHRTRP